MFINPEEQGTVTDVIINPVEEETQQLNIDLAAQDTNKFQSEP